MYQLSSSRIVQLQIRFLASDTMTHSCSKVSEAASSNGGELSSFRSLTMRDVLWSFVLPFSRTICRLLLLKKSPAQQVELSSRQRCIMSLPVVCSPLQLGHEAQYSLLKLRLAHMFSWSVTSGGHLSIASWLSCFAVAVRVPTLPHSVLLTVKDFALPGLPRPSL